MFTNILPWLRQYWYLVALVVVGGVALYLYTNPAPVARPISKRQERQVSKDMAQKQASAQQHTAAADRAAAAAAVLDTKAAAAADRAQALRTQTHHPHAFPSSTPLPDTAALRIQRILSSY